MLNWLYEILIVLAFSKKTLWAIMLGLLFFVGINFLGSHVQSNFELHGPYAGLTDMIKHKIANKYDKIAWAALISFWMLAVKLYIKDRRKIL